VGIVSVNMIVFSMKPIKYVYKQNPLPNQY